jgi:RNA polymerase sigma factor (sigma-70 family)
MSATLNALVQELYPQVKRYFRSRVPEPDCYDQANETIRAFLASDRAKVENPRAYLWGIARNQVLKYIRGRRASVGFDSELHSIAEFRTSISVTVVRRNRLLSALANLPVDHEDAFELHYAEGLTIDEVASVMGKSAATVKRHLASARQALAKQLGVPEDGFSDVETRQLVEAYRAS